MSSDPLYLGYTAAGHEFIDYDPHTKKLTKRIVQDVEPVIEQNKVLKTDGTNGYRNFSLHDPNFASRYGLGKMSKAKEAKHVARIPASVVQMWSEKYGVDLFKKENGQFLLKLLDDADNRVFRVDK